MTKLTKDIQLAAAYVLLQHDQAGLARPEAIHVTVKASDGADLPVTVSDEDRAAAEKMVAEQVDQLLAGVR